MTRRESTRVSSASGGAGKLIEPPVSKVATGKTWDGREPNQSRAIVVYER